MSIIPPDFIAFLSELKENNTSEWFHANKKRYEKSVKQPFQKLVQEMIDRIKVHEPEIEIKASEAIFRINRDIRFSADKSPYKTNVAANISQFGRKSKEYPGFYIHIDSETMMIGGGAYMVEKESLHKIREELSDNFDEFNELANEPAFVKHYKEIQGEKNKVMPPAFKEAAKAHPIIANKQFYFMADLPAKEALRPDLPDYLMEYYLAGKNVNDFLKEAMAEEV